jgi:hypothetical protein
MRSIKEGVQPECICEHDNSQYLERLKNIGRTQ